jgi:hypothetical protein
MPATPVFALPYPSLSDTADVPRDIQALAVRLDGLSLVPPVVTALPGSPVDGQEIYYQADAAAGIYWHLRYRAGATGAYKWEFVGGSPLTDEWLASEGSGVSANAWGGISANDPLVTVPLAGDYDAQHSVGLTNSVNALISIGLKIGATEPVGGTNNVNSFVTGGTWATLVQRRRLSALAAATAISQRYFTNAAGTLTRSSAHLALTPFRVG